MSFVEMKELVSMIFFAFLFGPVALYAISYIFAKVTYKIHKTRINAKKYERLVKMGGKLYV